MTKIQIFVMVIIFEMLIYRNMRILAIQQGQYQYNRQFTKPHSQVFVATVHESSLCLFEISMTLFKRY
jgi:hypothetical protein